MTIRAQKLWQRGLDHFRLGNMPAAQATFESLLVEDPESAPARFRLSLILASQGRFNAAQGLATAALALQPDLVEMLPHLANYQLMSGRPELARATATRALSHSRENVRSLDALAAVLARLGEQALSLELFDQTLAIEPENAALYFNRGLAHKQFGSAALAQQDFESCLRLNAGHAKSHWTLADLQSQSAQHNHVARLREQLPLTGPASVQEELIALALFKELDDLGDPEAAWPFLARGIASRRQRWRDPGFDSQARMDALVRLCDESFMRPATQVPPAMGPVFIFGMPRSGVATMARLLSRHSLVHHLGLQQPFFRLLSQEIGRDSVRPFEPADFERCRSVDFEALGRRYLEEVTPSDGRQLLVCESHPLNFMLAPLIANALPHARMLHMVRDPTDNCVSILGHPGNEPSLPSHDPAMLAASYASSQQLMQRWHPLLPGRIMDVGYESLVEKPEMILRVVCSFLGIRYASTLRTNLQLNSRSIGRGARYAARLDGIVAGLSGLAGPPPRE